MQFIPPYDQVGVTPPGPWTNAAPQAGVQGSIVNAEVFPAVQNEILAIIAADSELTPSAADLGQAQKSIASQIAKAVAAIPAPAAPPVSSATAKGGLAKDASNNFLLALLTNLTVDTRATPVAADVLALGRAADGAMVSVSAAALASYILANIVATATFQEVVVSPVLYVRTDGNDGNPGTGNTSGQAKATIAAAIAAGIDQYNFSTSSLTIVLGIPGTYAVPPNGIPPASGPITIQGDPNNQDAYVITGSGLVGYGGTITLYGVNVINTASNSSVVSSTNRALLTLQNTTLTQSANGLAHIFGGAVNIGPGCKIVGSGTYLAYGQGNGTIYFEPNITVTLVGNPNFANAVLFSNGSGAQVYLDANVSFAGSATGKTYMADLNGSISLNNNAVPGNANGTTQTGGQVV